MNRKYNHVQSKVFDTKTAVNKMRKNAQDKRMEFIEKKKMLDNERCSHYVAAKSNKSDNEPLSATLKDKEELI